MKNKKNITQLSEIYIKERKNKSTSKIYEDIPEHISTIPLSEKILKIFNMLKSNNEKENKSNNGVESDIKKTYFIKGIEITKKVEIIETSNDY